jgi:CBS domain-containing protein
VKELDLGFKKVISVSLETKVVEAFHLMSELNITGVAVVDNEGALFSALSAKDIKVTLVSFSIHSFVNQSNEIKYIVDTVALFLNLFR